MADFAKLDENNVVTQVLTVADATATSEEAGVNFLKTVYNEPDAVWKQTWEDGSQRKNFAGIGFTYDSSKDAFIPPQPYPSWTLNDDTCEWDPPVPYPSDTPVDSDGNPANYKWDEDSQSWIVVPYPADPS